MKKIRMMMNEYEEVIQQLSSVGEFPGIQYIIQHSRPIPITFHPFQQFFTDDILNIITFYKFVKVMMHFRVICNQIHIK
jgi:hypothetical protein